MVYSAPKIMRLAVDLHEYLVQMPLPVRIRPHSIDPVFTNFCGEHRAKSIPPVPHRFVADVDAALVQQILDVSERKWKSNVEHHSQADYLGAAVEAFEWVCFRHGQRLRNRPTRLNPNPFDKD